MDRISQKLRAIVGEPHMSVSRTDRELYSYDASLARGTPGIIVFPGNATEVALVVRILSEAAMPFVPRGFGTNLSGGTVLVAGGVVICLSRMNRILDILPERRCAVVQPGVTNLELQQALAPLGFFYAPDPASQKVSTMGGNVGENSGGPHCLKYGVTTNHILGLEVVLADGEILRLGGAALDPPGYDLRGVMVGSEGTFGIITEITTRILPKPEAVMTLLAVYDDISDAARTVSDITAAGMVPAALEMMDAPIIKAVEDSYACGYPRDAAAVLIIEIEGPAAGLMEQARHIEELCRENRCRRIHQAGDEAERNRLWEGRRGAFGAVARLAPNYLVNDCTVPRTRLPDALSQVAEISRRYGFDHGNVFHAGDGNMHPLIFFDSRDPDQVKRVKQAGWEIMEACVDLGGTITGEHGVGIEKLQAMRMICSEADFDLQRDLGRAFDAGHLLNPGKVVPAAGSTSQLQGRSEHFRPLGEGRAEQKVQSLIQSAIAEGRSLAPVGMGFSKNFGNILQEPFETLSSKDLCDILEYDPANQVVTVGTGLSLERLQETLAEKNQWLPLRPSSGRKNHSIGGLVGLGACGPERLAYGGLRDLLLGLRFVSGKGRFITAGGKVVKNVAGYDVTRLMAGSMGTLGLITRATLRVATLPECCMAVSAEGPLEGCVHAALRILTSRVEPIFLVARPVVPEDHEGPATNWQMSVGLEGFAPTVADQISRIKDLIRAEQIDPGARVGYNVYDGLWADADRDIHACPFVLRVDVPRDALPDMVKDLQGVWLGAGLHLDLGCGRIWAGGDVMENAAWAWIDRSAGIRGGHAILTRAPEDFKRIHDVFGSPRPEWRVMHRIKAALDPYRIFSTGRLPGKI